MERPPPRSTLPTRCLFAETRRCCGASDDQTSSLARPPDSRPPPPTRRPWPSLAGTTPHTTTTTLEGLGAPGGTALAAALARCRPSSGTGTTTTWLTVGCPRKASVPIKRRPGPREQRETVVTGAQLQREVGRRSAPSDTQETSDRRMPHAAWCVRLLRTAVLMGVKTAKTAAKQSIVHTPQRNPRGRGLPRLKSTLLAPPPSLPNASITFQHQQHPPPLPFLPLLLHHPEESQLNTPAHLSRGSLHAAHQARQRRQPCHCCSDPLGPVCCVTPAGCCWGCME